MDIPDRSRKTQKLKLNYEYMNGSRFHCTGLVGGNSARPLLGQWQSPGREFRGQNLSDGNSKGYPHEGHADNDWTVMRITLLIE